MSLGHLADDWPLDQAIDTARIAMQRRGCDLTTAGEALYRCLFDKTAAERQAAIHGATVPRRKR